MQFFTAPRCLLNQVAVLHRHSDLMAQGQKQPQFCGREITIVGCSEQQHAKHALFCLQTDSHHRTQFLTEEKFSYVPERFFFFQRFPLRVRLQIAQHDETTQPRHQANDVIIQIVALYRGAKSVAHPGDDHGSGTVFFSVMQAKRAGRNAHDIQNTVERLRQHLLNLAARKARGSQVQIREREHVALYSTAFFLIDRHHHQHAAEKLGQQNQRQQVMPGKWPKSFLKNRRQTQQSPSDESYGEELVSAGFLFETFFPKGARDEEKQQADAQTNRYVHPTARIA